MSLEAKRVQALEDYRILDTAPHPSFDSVTRAAQIAFDTPIALISLVDSYRQWFKASIGLDIRESPRKHSFCTHAIKQDEVYVVESAEDHPLFKTNPLVTGAPHIRFYAGAPIIDPEGFALGTLCVIDREPRAFGDRDRRLLAALAECAMAAMTLHSQSLLLQRADRLIKRYMGRQLVA
ncbi:GAF domain-containing protein [Maricaulaceae bacterium MS644]